MHAPRWLLPILLFVTAIAASHSVMAGPEGDDWYSIELIIFARNAADSGLTEEWPQEQALPDWSEAIPLTERTGGILPASQVTATLINIAPRSTYQLSGIERRLGQTDDRFEPLLHLAWRQPVISREKADSLYLQAPFSHLDSTLTVVPPRLEGTIKISRSRYLHVDLDLVLRKAVNQDYAQTGYPAIGGYAPFTHYRMQDHRRMRSGELHYIDHPLMGIMVRIDPYQPPAPPEPPPATAAPSPATETPESPGPAEETQAPEEKPAASTTARNTEP